MKAKLTKEDITPEFKEAVKVCLQARAYAETMRAEVDKVKREVLAATFYSVAPEHRTRRDTPEIINDPKLDWLMRMEDFRTYHAELNKIERIRGIKPADMPDEHCPALVAEDLQSKAEHAMLDLFGEIMEVPNFCDMCTTKLDTYREAVDLACKLVVNLPGFKLEAAI